VQGKEKDQTRLCITKSQIKSRFTEFSCTKIFYTVIHKYSGSERGLGCSSK